MCDVYGMTFSNAKLIPNPEWESVRFWRLRLRLRSKLSTPTDSNSDSVALLEQYSERALKKLSNALPPALNLYLNHCHEPIGGHLSKSGNIFLWRYIWWPPVTLAMTWSKNDPYNSIKSYSELFFSRLSSFLSFFFLDNLVWPNTPPPTTAKLAETPTWAGVQFYLPSLVMDTSLDEFAPTNENPWRRPWGEDGGTPPFGEHRPPRYQKYEKV